MFGSSRVVELDGVSVTQRGAVVSLTASRDLAAIATGRFAEPSCGLAWTRSTWPDDVEFLGFAFRNGKIRISKQSLALFKQRLKRLSGRHWFVSMEDRLAKLRLYVKGWMNYYGLSQVYRDWPGLDTWLRRRLRWCGRVCRCHEQDTDHN